MGQARIQLEEVMKSVSNNEPIKLSVASVRRLQVMHAQVEAGKMRLKETIEAICEALGVDHINKRINLDLDAGTIILADRDEIPQPNNGQILEEDKKG